MCMSFQPLTPRKHALIVMCVRPARNSCRLLVPVANNNAESIRTYVGVVKVQLLNLQRRRV